MRYWRSILLTAAACSQVVMSQTVEVPLTHWSYDLLDRLRTNGRCDLGTANTRPLSRTILLATMLKIYHESSERLSRTERESMAFLFYEFAEEVEKLEARDGAVASGEQQRTAQDRFVGWLPGPFYANARNLLAWRQQHFSFYFDPILYRDGTYNHPDTLDSQDRVLQNISGFTFWGTLGNKLGYYLNSRDTKEHGTRSYPTSSRITWPRYGFARGHGTHIYHDETIAYLFLSIPHLDFEVGKNQNRWGPGHTGSLMLNDYATSYDQIKLAVSFWKAKFTYLHGFLHQYPPLPLTSYESNGVERQIVANKYVAAHRLEMAPTPWLNFALHETILYGERGVELAYLNPIMFYRSAEHFLGDRDNAMMGADLEARPVRGLRLYGELLVDDFSVARLGESWYGNKTAWLAGLHATDPFGLPSSDWHLELVHLDPYVYSHTFPINVYQNYATSLGHWAAPNSELLHFEWLFWPQRQWRFRFIAEQYRHGANPDDRNVGGDIDRAFHVMDAQTVFFLDGIRERRRRFRLDASYELFRNLRVKAALEHTDFENAPATNGRLPVSTWSFFLALGLNAEE